MNLLAGHPVKYARFDKGFGRGDVLPFVGESRHRLCRQTKWTKRLAAEVDRCRYWKRFVDEDWVIEGIALWYQATSWDRPRRVTVTRKAQVTQDGQNCLLLDTDWQYEAIVTNLDGEAIDVWRFYNQRCAVIQYLRSLKSMVAYPFSG